MGKLAASEAATFCAHQVCPIYFDIQFWKVFFQVILVILIKNKDSFHIPFLAELRVKEAK